MAYLNRHKCAQLVWDRIITNFIKLINTFDGSVEIKFPGRNHAAIINCSIIKAILHHFLENLNLPKCNRKYYRLIEDINKHFVILLKMHVETYILRKLDTFQLSILHGILVKRYGLLFYQN